MTSPTALRATALASLRALIATRAASDAARKHLQALDPDGFQSWNAIPPAVEDALVGLIDAVLDAGEIAAYLLYECNRGPGKIIFPIGQEYPISTVEDVEKLLAEQYPIEEIAHSAERSGE
jgi:hypothetical protein